MYTDPLQNVYDIYPHPLDALFHPKSVAVIGAKDTVGSVGRTLLLNLTSSGFAGKIYPINPKRSEVLGIKCYPSVKEVPEEIDLAILVTPAKTIPALVKECVEARVKSLIIISAGFKELGSEGLKLEEEILATIKDKEIPIIGPNCLGVMNPLANLNASFAKGMALSGNIAFISQSGAMCTAVLDWSLTAHLGFSAFVSIGSMIDVNWGDLIRYFGSDPNTSSILIYMETIGDPRAFLSAAKEISLDKPIIVIKPGRSQEAASAAASHTGSLTGSDEVFDAALERVGVLRVNTISELFDMAEVLGKQPRPKGRNLQIITNAGGPAVLATDAAIISGAKIPPLTEKTKDELNTFLPDAWSHANPVDILGDADAERYAKTLDVLSKDTTSDGLLVVLSPQDMTDPTGTAEALRHFAKIKGKPILASWMGGAFVEGGKELLTKARIPTFDFPDSAAKSFATMCQYNENLKSLYETPEPIQMQEHPKYKESEKIIEKAKSEGRLLLNEFESKEILRNFGIPVVDTFVAKSEEEAVADAQKIGFPVVLKLFSDTITHKSDIGGVKLNLTDVEAVKKSFNEIKRVAKNGFQGVTVQPMIKLKGFELILGASTDPQFGPVLLFGTGGVMVEIYKDRALGFPPLNRTLARRMMEKTKIYEALQGFRGQKAVDMEALEGILVAFSNMISSLKWIKECDINPLLAGEGTLIGLDARILLHDKEPSKLAIRPYPTEYVVDRKLKNGKVAHIRPIRPEDEPAVEAFHKELSERSVRQRYFAFKSLEERIAHARLVRICSNDFDHQIALIAEDKGTIMGIGRLTKVGNGKTCDLKMMIGDAFHGQGLGTLLVQELIAIARKEGVEEIHATVLSENSGMLHILKKLGFTLKDEAPYTTALFVLHRGVN